MAATGIGDKRIRCWEGAIVRSREPQTSEAGDEGACTRNSCSEKKFRCHCVNKKCTGRPQDFHSTPRRPQLDAFVTCHYAWIFMRNRTLAGVLCLFLGGAIAARADDAATFRLFLTDGTSLVSYGEFARVGDRVVFSMPTAATGDPRLQLVDLAANLVDWDRTNRYAASARTAHYIETQGDNDYTALSNQVAQSLDEVAATADPAKRLAIVQRARKALADWPANHFNYRAAEIRQMLTMLDEAIADLRAASGTGRFDLALAAYADPAANSEPLLPRPTAKETIEQTLRAAQLAESPAERRSLLQSALDSIDVSASELPADWANTTRTETKATIEADFQTDRQYLALTQRMVDLAHRRAELADVRGVEDVLGLVFIRDKSLGSKRSDAVKALVASVEAELDAARKLRLARDRWAMRAPDFRKYRLAIAPSIELFMQLKPALEDIKALAGSTPGTLTAIHRLVGEIAAATAAIVPPDELKPAHAMLISAAELADSAARIRREAALAENIARAWDASSAAAGALMLSAQARVDIRGFMTPPKLR
jgi:hypothetical protein